MALDKEKKLNLEPDRIVFANDKIKELGYITVISEELKYIQFVHNKHTILFFPYTGWASGKGIKDGRGLNNLLKQLK